MFVWGEMFSHLSSLLTANTILRNELGKEKSGACSLNTQSKTALGSCGLPLSAGIFGFEEYFNFNESDLSTVLFDLCFKSLVIKIFIYLQL